MEAQDETRRYWIFQARIDVYDLKTNLVVGESVEWRIRDHAKLIKPRDIVFFWLAGEERGIYGWGEITDAPYPNKSEPSLKGEKQIYNVPAIYRVRFKNPLLAENLLTHPVLSELQILRQPAGSSFRVTREQVEALIDMIKNDAPPEIVQTPSVLRDYDVKDPVDQWKGVTSGYLLSDHWAERDNLNFNSYVGVIEAFLTNESTQLPLTFSIQAPWGVGKTTLMHMIQKRLDKVGYERSEKRMGSSEPDQVGLTLKEVLQFANNPRRSVLSRSTKKQKREFVSVWFNAWRYQSCSQVWAGLGDAIIRQIGDSFDLKDRERFYLRLNLQRINTTVLRRQLFTRTLNSFVKKGWAWLVTCISFIIGWLVAFLEQGLLISLLPPAVSLAIAVVASYRIYHRQRESIEDEQAKLSLSDCLDIPDYRREVGLVHQVEADIRRALEVMGSDTKLIIFIDDLDRCSPNNVAEVFEGLNLFLAGGLPNCIIFLGIDTELVAAALEKAHEDILKHLPADSKRLSIGWRFIDKFVQMPFVIPPVDDDDLDRFMISLAQDLRTAGEAASMDMGASYEESSTGILSSEDLAEAAQEKAKDEATESFDDYKRSEEVKTQLRQARQDFSTNPREFKRFLNTFRFYYALRRGRINEGKSVPTLPQLRRWIRLMLEWPQAERWLKRSVSRWEESNTPSKEDIHAEPTPSANMLAVLEEMGENSETIDDWLKHAKEKLGITSEEASWIDDVGLFRFFRDEAMIVEKQDRLSQAAGEGFW